MPSTASWSRFLCERTRPPRARPGASAPWARWHVSSRARRSPAVRVVLQGLRRVKLGPVEEEHGCAWSDCERLEPAPVPADEAGPAREQLEARLTALAESDPTVARELTGLVARYGDDDERITDLVASLLPLSDVERVRCLCEPSPRRRTEHLLRFLEGALVRAQAGRGLEGRVAERLRRRYLRAKLAELKDELGEPSAHELEIARFRERIE